MRILTTLFVVAATSQLALAAQPQRVDNDDDNAAKLQGQWQLVKLVDPLQSADEINNLVRSLIVEFKANDMIMRGGDFSGWVWSYTIDASKSPRWMDWDEGRRTWEGIYKLDGDELTFCTVGWKDPPRPAEFKANGDAPYVLMIFKRIRPRE